MKKIKNSLEKISKKFGKKVKIQNKEFFLFPKPEKLANASIEEIKKCGVGYRAPFIKQASKMIVLKKINFNEDIKEFEATNLGPSCPLFPYKDFKKKYQMIM